MHVGRYPAPRRRNRTKKRYKDKSSAHSLVKQLTHPLKLCIKPPNLIQNTAVRPGSDGTNIVGDGSEEKFQSG